MSEDLLSILPQPVIAVMFLFPINDKTNVLYEKLMNSHKSEPHSKSLFFIKQTIDNACGTMALLHSILNNLSVCQPVKDSMLDKYYHGALSKTPKERADLLEDNKELAESHEQCAQNGSTEADMDTNNHFICFMYRFNL